MLVGSSVNIDDLPFAALEIRQDRIVLKANKGALDIGVVVGSNCWDTYGQRASIPEADKEFLKVHDRAPDGGTKCLHCRADEALATQRHVTIKEKIGETLWEIHWIPSGPDSYYHYGIDITEGDDGA